MPITYIPSPLTESIERFGLALGDRLAGGPEKRREKALQADPQKLKVFGTLARRAIAAGPDAKQALAQSYGVSPEFADHAAQGVLPGLEEQVEEGARDRGLGETLVNTTILDAAFKEDSLEQLMAGGGGRIAGLAQLAGLNVDLAQGRVESQYWTLFDEKGGPRLRATADIGDLAGRIRDQGLSETHAEFYRNWVNSLDQSTPEGRQAAYMAGIFMENPQFGNYLAQREAADLRMQLARFQAIPTIEEKVDFSISLVEKMATAFHDLNEFEEEGAPQDVLNGQSSLLKGYSDLYVMLRQEGMVVPFETLGVRPDRTLFGREKGVEVTPEPVTERVAALQESIRSGELDPADLTEEDLEFLDPIETQSFAEFMQSFSSDQEVEEAEFTEDTTPGFTRAESFLGKGQLIDRLKLQLTNALEDPELSGAEKQQRILRIRDQIRAAQEQESLFEMMRRIREENQQRGGSLRIPGNDGNR